MEEYLEKWIGIEEAAEYLGVNKDTIRSWKKRTRRFLPAELESSGNLSARNWMRG